MKVFDALNMATAINATIEKRLKELISVTPKDYQSNSSAALVKAERLSNNENRRWQKPSLSGFTVCFGVICGFFPKGIIRNEHTNLSSLQESIIILSIFQLTTTVISDHMNIQNKRRFANQFSQG